MFKKIFIQGNLQEIPLKKHKITKYFINTNLTLTEITPDHTAPDVSMPKMIQEVILSSARHFEIAVAIRPIHPNI